MNDPDGSVQQAKHHPPFTRFVTALLYVDVHKTLNLCHLSSSDPGTDEV